MLKIIDKFRENFKWQTFTIIGLTAIAYGFLINNINLWLDEIYSVLMAKDSFSDMWFLLSTEDSKPPLYYLYLKFVLWLFPKSYEIAAAHLGSVILLLATQIFAATAVKRDYGHKTALWLMILIAVLPQSLWLGLEVRTYMLSSLLLLMASVYGARLFNQPHTNDYVKFGLVSVLALYSHYYCAIFLMFLYGAILIFLITGHKAKKAFLWASGVVALLFMPWLLILFNTFKNIQNVWYVHEDFVLFSWEFFTNPLSPEIVQSVYFIATTLSASVFSFLLVVGLFNIHKFALASRRTIILTLGCFCLTYILLLCLSETVRPIVTARYLKIFSMPLYLTGAIVITKYKEISKAVLAVLLIGFYFTYIDVRAISFDEGYKNVIHDIREFIPKDKPLISTDNSNVFCEYYLPEYTCLLLVGKTGEILRRKTQMTTYEKITQLPQETIFSISVYSAPKKNDGCKEYKSLYRFGQNIRLCRFDNLQEVFRVFNKSREFIRKRLAPLDS